jgi:hypothetical protein
VYLNMLIVIEMKFSVHQNRGFYNEAKLGSRITLTWSAGKKLWSLPYLKFSFCQIDCFPFGFIKHFVQNMSGIGNVLYGAIVSEH